MFSIKEIVWLTSKHNRGKSLEELTYFVMIYSNVVPLCHIYNYLLVLLDHLGNSINFKSRVIFLSDKVYIHMFIWMSSLCISVYVLF
jgi:hypothetical protein